MNTQQFSLRCDWCDSAPPTELLIRYRPTSCGGTDRACSLACSACGDRLSRTIARIEDVTAMFRLVISPLIPISEEAAGDR